MSCNLRKILLIPVASLALPYLPVWAGLLGPVESPPVHLEALRGGEERFRHRLRGHDDGWIEAGSQRAAFPTKVTPGHHTLEAAMERDGVWSAEPAAILFQMVPRFHQTRLFLVACGLAFLGVLAGVVWLRDRRAEARRRALEETVRRRTATIREQAEQLRRLDQLRAQLFANVSHEFRTPLTLILGPARDLQQGAFGPLTASAQAQVALVERNAERLLTLVDQLLEMARLDAGGFELTLRRSDLAEFLRRRIEAFQPLAERRGVVLRTRIPNVPVPLVFDPEALRKVLDNLLSNALRFTLAERSVRVALDVPAPDGAVTFWVRDEGPGIAEDQRERIFERFQRSAEGESVPGFGLGLALARQLTERHGGTLELIHPPGGGACFVVTLPRSAPAEAAQWMEAVEAVEAVAPAVAARLEASAPSTESRESAGGATLLIVDDNGEIRSYLRRHLDPLYTVVEAGDGLEALEQVRRFPPDLVISDVRMPGLDGKDLVRTLRRDARWMLVPVILVTAKASAESRLAALREGVDDYLIKPFDPQELLARVENLLTVRRRLLAATKTPTRPLQVAEIEVTPADERFLERLGTLVEENLGKPDLTVERLAALMGCDRSYLLRKLRALTGETPSELIRSFRLQRAEQLLRARAGSVTDVAYAVGFKTVPHFSNAFLDRFGERPSAFVQRQDPS